MTAYHRSLSATKAICTGTLALIMLVLLAASGCDSGPEEDTARINARGVDGVQFGDSLEHVLEVLGQYDVFANTDGARGWHSYIWEDGPYAGLKIRFLEEFIVDDNGLENVVTGVVDAFDMFSPYNGQTAEGIGIGSTKREVDDAYGSPIGIISSSHIYCLDKRDLEVIILADTVFAVIVGYHKPLPLDFQFCND